MIARGGGQAGCYTGVFFLSFCVSHRWLGTEALILNAVEDKQQQNRDTTINSHHKIKDKRRKKNWKPNSQIENNLMQFHSSTSKNTRHKFNYREKKKKKPTYGAAKSTYPSDILAVHLSARHAVSAAKGIALASYRSI